MSGNEQVEAWKAWCDSAEGEGCRSGSANGKYLENRLWRAFMAGINANEKKADSTQKTTQRKTEPSATASKDGADDRI